MALNQGAKARRTWEDLLAKHADDQSPRVAEATFNLGLTYGAPPSSTTGLDLSVAKFKAFIEKYPTHKLASRAYQEIGQAQMQYSRYEDAANTFTAYLDDPRYADREETPTIRFQLGRSLQRQKKYD